MKNLLFVFYVLVLSITYGQHDTTDVISGGEKPTKNTHAIKLSYFHLFGHTLHTGYRLDFKKSRLAAEVEFDLQYTPSLNNPVYNRDLNVYRYDSTRVNGVGIGVNYNALFSRTKWANFYFGIMQRLKKVTMFTEQMIWVETDFQGFDALTQETINSEVNFWKTETFFKVGFRGFAGHFFWGMESGVTMIINIDRAKQMQGITQNRYYAPQDYLITGDAKGDAFLMFEPIYMYIGLVF